MCKWFKIISRKCYFKIIDKTLQIKWSNKTNRNYYDISKSIECYQIYNRGCELKMSKEELFKILYGKEKWEVYKNFKSIENEIMESNKYYEYIDDFFKMLDNENSHIKLRGFKLICKLAKYDEQDKIKSNIDLLLSVLDDDRPSIVRQCLSDINLLLLYIPQLSSKVERKLKNLNVSKYKDTMKPLIEKDIKAIIEKLL